MKVKCNMNKVAKYQLKFKKNYEDFKDYWIKGLTGIYCKDDWFQVHTYNGAAGLLKTPSYPGYCVLCQVYHSNKSDELPAPGHTIEFSPLYNKNGEIILLKYDSDVSFASVDSNGHNDYDTGLPVESVISFWNNGTFTEFTD